MIQSDCIKVIQDSNWPALTLFLVRFANCKGKTSIDSNKRSIKTLRSETKIYFSMKYTREEVLITQEDYDKI